MKRSQFLGLLVAIALCGVLVASSQPVLSQGNAGRQTIVAIDRNNDDRELPALDAGRKNFSPGDLTVFRTVLYDEGNDNRIGNLTARCSVLKVARRSVGFLCDGIVGLEDGKLSFEGIVGFGQKRRPSHLAITGGTGGFDQASGGVTVEGRRRSTKITVNVKTR